MDKSNIFKAINLAFTPACEMDTPKLFCGRENEIEKGIKALRSPNASLCIYGNRGVGKSSISKQLMLIAAGLKTLIDDLGKSYLFDPDQFKMPNAYFCCDATIKNAEDLFRKLLADRDSIHGLYKYNKGVILEKIKNKQTSNAKFTLKIFEAALDGTKEVENITAELDYVSAFKSVTSEIADAAGVPAVTVVIDDFELIADKVGIASIIRSTPTVKFILVGVADDYRKLISDHRSVARQLSEGMINVSMMDDKMLASILIRAQQVIGDIAKIKFTKEAIASITAAARGFPYWVHRIGKECYYDAVEKEIMEIDESCYHRALKKVVEDEIELEDEYKQIVGTSSIIEAVLKILAFDRKDEHNIIELTEKLNDNKNIKIIRAKDIIDELIEKGILSSNREGFCSFVDSRFKGFACARPPLFDDNTEKILTEKSEAIEVRNDMENWTYVMPVELTINKVLESYENINTFSTLGTTAIIPWSYNGEKDEALLYDHKGDVIRKKRRKRLG